MGDRNTKYFHQKANWRQRGTSLNGLFDESGDWHNDKTSENDGGPGKHLPEGGSGTADAFLRRGNKTIPFSNALFLRRLISDNSLVAS